MKKIVLLILLVSVVFMTMGCDPVRLYDKEAQKSVDVEYYGVFNKEVMREDVVYQVSPAAVICSIIFVETVVVPVVLIGWNLYEPVRFEGQ